MLPSGKGRLPGLAQKCWVRLGNSTKAQAAFVDHRVIVEERLIWSPRSRVCPSNRQSTGLRNSSRTREIERWNGTAACQHHIVRARSEYPIRSTLWSISRRINIRVNLLAGYAGVVRCQLEAFSMLLGALRLLSQARFAAGGRNHHCISRGALLRFLFRLLVWRCLMLWGYCYRLCVRHGSNCYRNHTAVLSDRF